MSKTVAIQRFLSETSEGSSDYVVAEYENDALTRSVHVATYDEATQLKEQWDSSSK